MADAESERLTAWLVALFEARTGVDLTRTDDNALQRLRSHVEEARAAWKPGSGLEMNLPFLTSGPRGPIDLEERLSADEARRVFAGERLEDRLDAARVQRGQEDAAAKAARIFESGDAEDKRTTWLAIKVVAVAIALIAATAIATSLADSHGHAGADKHEGTHAR